MSEVYTNFSLQTLIGMFLVAFSLLIVVLGLLLLRFRFLDGRSFYFSSTLGKGLIIVGSLTAMTSFLLLLIYIAATS